MEKDILRTQWLSGLLWLLLFTMMKTMLSYIAVYPDESPHASQQETLPAFVHVVGQKCHEALSVWYWAISSAKQWSSFCARGSICQSSNISSLRASSVEFGCDATHFSYCCRLTVKAQKMNHVFLRLPCQFNFALTWNTLSGIQKRKCKLTLPPLLALTPICNSGSVSKSTVSCFPYHVRESESFLEWFIMIFTTISENTHGLMCIMCVCVCVRVWKRVMPTWHQT